MEIKVSEQVVKEWAGGGQVGGFPSGLEFGFHRWC